MRKRLLASTLAIVFLSFLLSFFIILSIRQTFSLAQNDTTTTTPTVTTTLPGATTTTPTTTLDTTTTTLLGNSTTTTEPVNQTSPFDFGKKINDFFQNMAKAISDFFKGLFGGK